MMCIAFAMAVLPIFSTRSKLDDSAAHLMRLAELGGHTNWSAAANNLQADTDMAFTTDWNGTAYIVGSNKVQLGNDIKLTLTTQEQIEFGALSFSYPITLTATVHGTSEVYHK